MAGKSIFPSLFIALVVCLANGCCVGFQGRKGWSLQMKARCFLPLQHVTGLAQVKIQQSPAPGSLVVHYCVYWVGQRHRISLVHFLYIADIRLQLFCAAMNVVGAAVGILVLSEFCFAAWVYKRATTYHPCKTIETGTMCVWDIRCLNLIHTPGRKSHWMQWVFWIANYSDLHKISFPTSWLAFCR